MKTAAELQPTVAPPRRAVDWRPAIRIGVVLSLVAVAAAVVLRSLLAVPPVVLVATVAAVGFALSWHAVGPRPAPRSRDPDRDPGRHPGGATAA